MLTFKWFDSAVVTVSRIELVQKIHKHQFKIGTLGGRSATMPETLERGAGRLIRNVRNAEVNRPRKNFAPKPVGHTATG
ncbi:MAG TPA: hypothetical protein VK638_54755 [Edaphobacter sp.]|nr:hypothetical protein [Edaphobacter sp.]